MPEKLQIYWTLNATRHTRVTETLAGFMRSKSAKNLITK